jgi:hypothetical protein
MVGFSDNMYLIKGLSIRSIRLGGVTFFQKSDKFSQIFGFGWVTIN